MVSSTAPVTATATVQQSSLHLVGTLTIIHYTSDSYTPAPDFPQVLGCLFSIVLIS